MQKISSVVIRCIACVNGLLMQNELANEARKIDDAEIAAFESLIDPIAFYVIRS